MPTPDRIEQIVSERDALPSRGGIMVYKCRMCGVADKSTHCPSIVLAAKSLLASGKASGIEFPRLTYMTRLHVCPDGCYGMSDLVGFEPDAEDTTPSWFGDVEDDYSQ
jgi:hypothetical protein